MFRFSKSLLWVNQLRTFGLFFISAFVICLSPKEASADPDTLWTRRFGGGPGYDAHQTSDGGFVFVHWYVDQSDLRSRLVKTDSNGDTVWTRMYLDQLPQMPYSLGLTANEGFIIAATSDESPTFLIRADSFGDTIWTRGYGSETNDSPTFIEETFEGGFVLCGLRWIAFPLYHMFWMKLDSNGDSVWCQRLEGAENDYAGSIRQTPDGGYILAGSSQGSGCLIKTDEYGEIVWLRYTGGDLEDVWPTNDGGYIGVGNVTQEWLSTKMIYLVKADSLGNLVWSKLFGETGEDKWNLGYAVQQTSDSGYVLAGEAGPWAQTDLYIVKTDVSGNMEWSRRYSGGSGEDRAYSIEETKRDGVPDGGYIVAGSGGAWLLRLGEDTSVDDGFSNPPNNVEQIQVYPNPFNSVCRIAFNGRKSTVVSLTIHNLMGEIIREHAMVAESNGEYSLTWDGHGYPSGIYFVRIMSGGEIYSRKIVLLK